jgi:hypothetical protein
MLLKNNISLTLFILSGAVAALDGLWSELTMFGCAPVYTRSPKPETAGFQLLAHKFSQRLLG